MKRLICLLTAVCMVFLLCACIDDTTIRAEDVSEDTQTKSADIAPVGEPAEQPDVPEPAAQETKKPAKKPTESSAVPSGAITEDVAVQMAIDYWDVPDPKPTPEDGDLHVLYSGLTYHNGVQCHCVLLQWWVSDHWSTVSFLYIDAASGQMWEN